MVQESLDISEFSGASPTLGFTGTRKGMTRDQFLGVFELIDLRPFSLARHGDCVGADEEFDEIASVKGLCIHIHPCNIDAQRAWTKNFSIEHPVKAPLLRNRDIVNLCDILLATPSGLENELRSGTWATIRYAKSIAKPYRIIYPDGTMEDTII